MDINGASYWGSDSDKAQLDSQFDRGIQTSI
jgi:hypothetical protein